MEVGCEQGGRGGWLGVFGSGRGATTGVKRAVSTLPSHPRVQKLRNIQSFAVIVSVTAVMAIIEVEDKGTLGIFIFCALLGCICNILSQ